MITPSPERWARIEAALDAVLDRLDEPREAVLAELCGDDVELRREVERLLRSIDASDQEFERPPTEIVEAAAAVTTREQLQPGDIVGHYRVVELIGRGGMGAVYLAERADGSFDRQVALKVVKRGMDTDEILRRFQRERQILARLEHPNIAGLLDGGVTDDGLPYFVMELAHGQPIDVWCDEQRLAVADRIRLFLPVCDAVRLAHRNLIVHRDLKPGNILVVDGEPKLLDFGIAKMLSADEDESQATRLQERRLTPEYAAPEQVRNEPTTTATDVYSLGVVLYELLTGRPPYRVQGSLAEIERVVCTVEPRSPSSIAARDEIRGKSGETTLDIAARRSTRPEALQAALAGDLDAIVTKALAKEPERRYPSVEAFAEDLRRHLDGHPVEARPASRWYKLDKFIRRNRTAVGLATAAALALITGSGLALWQASRAEAESLRRQAEAERATAARDYLIGLFRDLNPDRLQGQRTFSLDDLIRLGVRNLEPLGDQPELQASVMNAVGEVVFNLGDDVRADSLFRRAHAILEPAGDHPDLAESKMGLGEIDRRADRFEQAERWLRGALVIREKSLSPDDPRIAESIAELAFALYNIGSPASLAESDSLYQRVLGFRGRVSAETRAAALEGRADIRLAQDRHEEARQLYAESLEVWEAAVGPDHPSYGRCLWGLASTLSALGRDREAESNYRNARRIMVTTYGAEHRDVVWAEFFLGRQLARMQRAADAAPFLKRAGEVSERVNPPGYRYTGLSWHWFGLTQVALAQTRAAEAAFKRALLAHESGTPETVADNRLRAADTRRSLAELLATERRIGEAIEYLRSAYLTLIAAHPDDAPLVAKRLAEMFERTGQADSVAAYRTRAAQAHNSADSAAVTPRAQEPR